MGESRSATSSFLQTSGDEAERSLEFSFSVSRRVSGFVFRRSARRGPVLATRGARAVRPLMAPVPRWLTWAPHTDPLPTPAALSPSPGPPTSGSPFGQQNPLLQGFRARGSCVSPKAAKSVQPALITGDCKAEGDCCLPPPHPLAGMLLPAASRSSLQPWLEQACCRAPPCHSSLRDVSCGS